MTFPLIGLFGGTFNPIHNGHLHLANQILNDFEMQEIRFIPSANPPLKDLPIVSATQRAKMVALAIEHQPKFKLDTLEMARNGKSYTIDTLISLRETLGDEVSLCWLIGSDAFAKLDQWHRWQELFHYCHFIVIHRPGQAIAQKTSLLNDWATKHQTSSSAQLSKQVCGLIFAVEIGALECSSTQIRNAIKQKQPYQQWLAKEVAAFIAREQLYFKKVLVTKN